MPKNQKNHDWGNGSGFGPEGPRWRQCPAREARVEHAGACSRFCARLRLQAVSWASIGGVHTRREHQSGWVCHLHDVGLKQLALAASGAAARYPP